jgi:hypothetical protein
MGAQGSRKSEGEVMGYIKHHAIVVTGRDNITLAVEQAKAFGLTVVDHSEYVVNGYRSMMVCPDGSKEGWDNSDVGDEARECFLVWLREARGFEWVFISYGSDDADASIEETAWSDK